MCQPPLGGFQGFAGATTREATWSTYLLGTYPRVSKSRSSRARCSNTTRSGAGEEVSVDCQLPAA